MTAMQGKKNLLSGKHDAFPLEDSIGKFCEILKEDDTDFSLMLDLIFDDDKNSGKYGELVYPDEENFSGIEYVLKGDSVFLNFELSALGELGVFVRSGKEQVVINFLSGKGETLQFIGENESVLKKMLEQNGVKKSLIGYFDSKKIVDKIKLWSLDFYMKSEFNVKV